MTQERPSCYENTSDDKSFDDHEHLASSVNISCQTSSSRDQLARENGCALVLIKCLIWICFISLIVLALWILFYWRQPPDVVDLSTNKGWLNTVCIILIGVVYGLCSAFCAFFDSAIPGNTPPSPFAHKKSRSYSRLYIGSVTHDSDPSSPAHDDNMQTITVPVHRSGSMSIEYLMIPFNVVFVTVAVLLWLRNEMGITTL